MIQATTEKKTIRCAIYTRKSHEEGLEQEFNSLDAQRAAAGTYDHCPQHGLLKARKHRIRADSRWPRRTSLGSVWAESRWTTTAPKVVAILKSVSTAIFILSRA
jgi:hypothetical protein